MRQAVQPLATEADTQPLERYLVMMRQSRPMYDCPMMESFLPPFSQAAVNELRSRQQQTRWPETVIGEETSLGVNRDFLVDLCRYWIETFNWKSQLDRLFADLKAQAREVYMERMIESFVAPEWWGWRQLKRLILHRSARGPLSRNLGAFCGQIAPTMAVLPVVLVRKYCAVYYLGEEWHGSGHRFDPDQVHQ
jgi:hypothetical protein